MGGRCRLSLHRRKSLDDIAAGSDARVKQDRRLAESGKETEGLASICLHSIRSSAGGNKASNACNLSVAIAIAASNSDRL